MKKWNSLILIGLLCAAVAQGKENCDKAWEEIPKFDATKKMFNELFQFESKFSHCMDGGIAEAVEGVVETTINKSWSDLASCAELFKKERSFRKFLLTSIAPSVTGQEAEVNEIIIKAKTSCPSSMKSFCRDLLKAAEASLKSE